MPLALTNYFVLDEKTSVFASAALSFFPKDEPLSHNEYYQMGRMESSSVIRFLLRHEALRWAYFVLIGTLVLFILFEMKRRQRIIPELVPVKNSTLEFVSTLGSLHFRQKEHSNLAKKRLAFWQHYLRSHYSMTISQFDESIIDELVAKSDKDKTDITLLTVTAIKIQNDGAFTEEELLAYEQLLNRFYGIEKSE